MLYIKLDDDMSLVITVNEPIYRGDNLSQKITYLIPTVVGEIDMLTASVFLSYVRADGVADVVVLDRSETPYNESYFQYTFTINCKLSKYPGEVCTWIQIYSGTPSNPVIAKTGECMLQVQESKNMDDYLCDHQMTALYQLTHTMNTAIEDMNNTIENAIENKADNIIFNPEDSTIQLSANGVPVGDKIVVNTNTGAVVTNAGISSDNELILTFNDGTVKNLGSVMGKDGAVYVPHISERKVLTFTIEDEPGEIPEPVDLNPNDEWSEIEGDEVVSDYIWEPM